MSPSRDSGFSLVEVMIALGIFSLVFGAVAVTMVKTQESYSSSGLSSALRQQARVVMARISHEGRYVGYNLKTVSEAISTASADEFSFAGDIDLESEDPPCTGEAGTNAGVERVTYRRHNGDLQRQVECWTGAAWTSGTAFTAVATGLDATATLFRYYDEDGNELLPGGGGLSSSDRDNVVRVEVALALEDAGRSMFQVQTNNFEVATQILLRNRVE